MEEKPRRRTLREKAADLLELPVDVAAGLPLAELRGDRQLRVENHRGILSYSPKEIHIGGGKVTLRVWGEGMELKVMNNEELLICGYIRGVEIE